MKIIDIKDGPGKIPAAKMLEHFEECVRQTAVFSEVFPLEKIEPGGGRIVEYKDRRTHDFWIGFAIGMRCFERLENAGITPGEKSPLLPELPCISLWQPWANWVAAGFKTIETRTHKRFAGLVGKRIAIHAGQKFDQGAIQAATVHGVTSELNRSAYRNLSVGLGAVICTAKVKEFRELTAKDNQAALIECGGDVVRYGLILEDVRPLPKPIPYRGKQGIFKIHLTREEAGI